MRTRGNAFDPSRRACRSSGATGMPTTMKTPPASVRRSGARGPSRPHVIRSGCARGGAGGDGPADEPAGDVVDGAIVAHGIAGTDDTEANATVTGELRNGLALPLLAPRRHAWKVLHP